MCVCVTCLVIIYVEINDYLILKHNLKVLATVLYYFQFKGCLKLKIT